jgi:glyoxylase-like metal-dependent hydrolase (beta-lactamase superfamily II)
MNLNKLVQLSENVWVYPFGPGIQPNVGIVTTKSETILIDCGNSPKHAHSISQSLQDIGAPPVKYIIYTHHHWDHTFGGSHFNGTFVSHKLCFKYLNEYKKVKWSKEYLLNDIAREPLLKESHTTKMDLIDDWDEFTIKLPNITFNNELEMHFEGITLQLKHIGGYHADDSIIVKVKESNVLFVGDCFYPPSLHERKQGDTYSLDILKKLHQKNADIYVQGHGDQSNTSRLGEFIRFLEESK